MITYRNKTISKINARVFNPAHRCIYCPDGKPPFTREHVVPKGMGGGMIFPHASCSICQERIKEIETYCMRGPFLSHRLKMGLVQNLAELGDSLPIRFTAGDREFVRRFPTSEFPTFLVLPQLSGPPTMLKGGPPARLLAASFKLWGDETQLRALHKIGNAQLIQSFDLDKFSRAIAKIAHGFVLGELGIDNVDPFLPEFILGKSPEKAAFFIGDWPEDRMNKPADLLHQVGMAFENWGDQVRVQVRLRLFAAYDHTPAYRIVAGVLTKPLDEVLATLGMQTAPGLSSTT